MAKTREKDVRFNAPAQTGILTLRNIILHREIVDDVHGRRRHFWLDCRIDPIDASYLEINFNAIFNLFDANNHLIDSIHQYNRTVGGSSGLQLSFDTGNRIALGLTFSYMSLELQVSDVRRYCSPPLSVAEDSNGDACNPAINFMVRTL